MAKSQVLRTPGANGFATDASDLKVLAKHLREVDRKASRNLRRAERAVGEVIAVEARKRASEHSTSIPPTIKVRVAGGTIEVRAGTEDQPLARLFEVGNEGRGKSTFRHPVFGDKSNWVEQPMHPFLYRAGVAKRHEAIRLLNLAHVEALKDEGFAVTSV